MPKRSKSKKQQPVIIPVDSEDKQGLDPLPPQDHPASCCRAQRTLFCAPPHTGGTSTIKNCLVRSAPWAAVVIISGVGEHTAEWDKVVHTKTTFEEADADWWSALSKKHGGEPIACVVDDMDYSGLGVKAKQHAFQLTQFVCTHMNVTAFLRTHSWTQCVPRIRRACNCIVMWKPTTGGADALDYIARSLGYPKALIRDAFAQCRDKYEPIVLYTNPPPGRTEIMIGFDRPFYSAADDE